MRSMPSPLLLALGWSLLHFVWQGTLVAVAFAIARRAVQRRPPEIRHAVAVLGLVALLALPASTFVLVWTAASVSGEVAIDQRVAALSPGSVPRMMPWLLAFWSCGVLLLASRSAAGMVRLRRLTRRATEAPPVWRDRFDRLVARVGVGQKARLLTTSLLESPVVTGCFRPTVLLPLSALTGLPADQLEALILHELMHVKRKDLWVQRLQLLLETLFFYHPAVWWISRAVKIEREFCCDAAVVQVTGDRLGYARALTRLESVRHTTPRQALASTGGSLMSRIESIVTPERTSSTNGASTLTLSLAGLGLIAALVVTSGAIGGAMHAWSPAWMPESVTRFSSHFEEAAKEHGVEPALLSIVTLVESRGNPEAVSSFGAVGLMQVMPATAEKIAEKRGISDFEVKDLEDPAVNVDFGAWYLAQQIATFGDGTLSAETVKRAAAAYNGGPKRLRRHLEQGQPLTKEAERYSRIVTKLWLEREESSSQTLERMRRKGKK